MLAAFMEERNIRWGELIGGLLIVGPAIALVISFWDKLEESPYLQLTTFVSIGSAVLTALRSIRPAGVPNQPTRLRSALCSRTSLADSMSTGLSSTNTLP